MVKDAAAAATAQAADTHRELNQQQFQGHPASFLWSEIMREPSNLDVRRPVSGSVEYVPMLGIEQPVRSNSHG